MTNKHTNAAVQAINNIYGEFPAFTDIFDEETFYIFAACFTLCTLIAAVVASKFITIKEAD